MPAGKAPKAAATLVNVDKQGKDWTYPYEWLATYGIRGIKKQLMQAISSTGFCPICHRDDKKLAPANCPLLKELNVSPFPGGRLPVAHDASAAGSLPCCNCCGRVNFNYKFCCEGEKVVLILRVLLPLLVNLTILFLFTRTLVPQCSSLDLSQCLPLLSPNNLTPCGLPLSNNLAAADCSSRLPLGSTLHCIVLSKNLSAIIAHMSAALILLSSKHHFTVADSGVTDHMFPDKLAFISCKPVTNLQVRMGNNSYLPILA